MRQCLALLVAFGVVQSVLSPYPYSVYTPRSGQRAISGDEFDKLDAAMRGLSKSQSIGSGGSMEAAAPPSRRPFTPEEYHAMMNKQYGAYPGMAYNTNVGGYTYKGRVGDPYPDPQSGLPFRSSRRSYAPPARSSSFQQEPLEMPRNSRLGRFPTMGFGRLAPAPAPYAPAPSPYAPAPSPYAPAPSPYAPAPAAYSPPPPTSSRPLGGWGRNRAPRPTVESRPPPQAYQQPSETAAAVPPREVEPFGLARKPNMPQAQDSSPPQGNGAMEDTDIGALLGGGGAALVKGGAAKDAGATTGMDALLGGGRRRQEEPPKPLPSFNPQDGKQAADDLVTAVLGEIDYDLRTSHKLSMTADKLTAHCEQAIQKQPNCITAMKRADRSLIDVLGMFRDKLEYEIEAFFKKNTQPPFTCVKGSLEMKSYSVTVMECVRPALVLTEV